MGNLRSVAKALEHVAPGAEVLATADPAAIRSAERAGIAARSRFYFVHSYFPAPRDEGLTAATCVYGMPFTCAVARDNIFAVQFHPEKSQSAGLQLLSNFVRWRP